MSNPDQNHIVSSQPQDSELSEYGNPPASLYIAMSYTVVFIALASYVFFCVRQRQKALRSLHEEGFFPLHKL